MTDPRIRPLAITIAAVLVTSVLSVGQIRYEQQQRRGGDSLDVLPGDGDGPVDGATPGPGDGPASATPSPGAPGAPAATSRPSAGPGGATAGPGGPTAGPTTGPTRRPRGVPDFGLRTQGVTPTSIKLGLDYNKSGCGDGSALEAMLGPAVVGDPEKAIDAFERHVNETGGVRGRKIDVVTVDDGGPQCPDRNQAAAIQMVDQHKVFLAMVGLHEVGDAVIKRGIPIWGGRSTKAEQRSRGFGQFQLFQDADSDFANWASFGKHYLGSGPRRRPCFVHPDTPDFNNLDRLMRAKMAEYGLKFYETIRYADDASTAQQQATAAVLKMKGKCEQVWFIANNFIAMVFFSNAAAQQEFHPEVYTFTGRTALIDQQLGGALMHPEQWERAIGLSPRVKPGEHPKEGNCRRIYEKYHPADGMSGSASVTIACSAILSSTEAMKRAVDLTGDLTANSLMLGIDAIERDFYWEAHVPMTYTVPDTLAEPFDFTGYDHQTVVRWSRSAQDYVFPEYPRYWRRFGPNRSGAEDLRGDYRREWRAR